jgi:hypothetical protein
MSVPRQSQLLHLILLRIRFNTICPGSVPGRSGIDRYLYKKLNKNFTTKSVQFFRSFKRRLGFLQLSNN